MWFSIVMLVYQRVTNHNNIFSATQIGAKNTTWNGHVGMTVWPTKKGIWMDRPYIKWYQHVPTDRVPADFEAKRGVEPIKYGGKVMRGMILMIFAFSFPTRLNIHCWQFATYSHTWICRIQLVCVEEPRLVSPKNYIVLVISCGINMN